MFNLTVEEIKALLETPAALFILMLLSSMAHAWAQKREARLSGGGLTWMQYLAHVKETISMLIVNVIAFAVLIYTDQLNYAAVLGIGFGVNAAVDLAGAGGRSGALKTGSAPEEK